MLPLFTRDALRPDHYVPTASAASPWGPITLHGGAPTGLMAALMERQFAGADMQVVRLTVDLFRPVPMAPLAARTSIVRDGKRVKLLAVSLFHDDVEICRGSGLVLQKSDIKVPAHALVEATPPAAMLAALARPGRVGVGADDQRPDTGAKPPAHGLHTLIGLKPVALDIGSGRGCAWVRLPVEVIAGTANSPLVTVAAVADFSNGFAQLHLSPQLGFINADLTINLHRLPAGDWIGIDARALAQPHGLAMVEAVLYDAAGAIGRVSQANLTMARYQGE